MISEYLNIAKKFFPEDSIHYYKNEDFYVDGDGLSPFFSHFVLLKFVSDHTLFVAPKIAISKLEDGYELIPLSKYNNLAENFSLYENREHLSLSIL